METYLDKIVAYLKRQATSLLSANNTDGRINSINNEKEVINLIMSNPAFSANVKPAADRSFYDIEIATPLKSLYVNIKVSSMKQADNCSSKKGMGYALTGRLDIPNDYQSFHKFIVTELKPGFDYYFLIIDKNDITGSYWTSLKRIQELVPNGDNPPFQCNWGKNRIWSNRNEQEATKYIIDTYLKSWDRRISGYPDDLVNPDLSRFFTR